MSDCFSGNNSDLIKKEQLHCASYLVNSCIHTSQNSSQSVALVVYLVQARFVISASAAVLCCSCLSVSFTYLYMCYVQLQCTFPNVYIYIYIYRCILFICQSCSQNAVNLLHFYYKNYMNEMLNELWWIMWISFISVYSYKDTYKHDFTIVHDCCSVRYCTGLYFNILAQGKLRNTLLDW